MSRVTRVGDVIVTSSDDVSTTSGADAHVTSGADAHVTSIRRACRNRQRTTAGHRLAFDLHGRRNYRIDYCPE